MHLIRGRSARATLLAAMVVFTGLVFAVQDQAGWAWQIDQSRVWREGFPKDLSWIDHATDKELARIVVFYNPYPHAADRALQPADHADLHPADTGRRAPRQRLHVHVERDAERAS